MIHAPGDIRLENRPDPVICGPDAFADGGAHQ